MAVILQGSLAHFGPAELLRLLSGHAHTGTLEASSNKQLARIIFQDGVVVHAEATNTHDAKEAVLAPFTWTGGSFTFIDQANVPAGTKQPTLDLPAVIEEGTQRASEWRQLASAYPDESTTLQVVEDAAMQGNITLKPEEFRILVRIGTGRSIGQLTDDLQSSFIDVCRILHRLETAGLLRRIEPAPPKQQGFPAAIESKTPTLERPKPKSEPVAEAAPELPPPSTPSVVAAPPVGTLTAPTGSMFPLVESEVTIGRDLSCGVVISDASISNTHAKITQTPEGFMLEDLGSRNGTFVNGDRVTQRRLLVNHDVVRLGKVVLTFNLAVPAPLSKATLMQR